MISICIPIFNRNVIRLVEDLLHQIEERALDAELLLFDDGSDEAVRLQNDPLRDYKRVTYLPLIENIGSSRIRNRMADMAQGEWLLFLDCDVSVMSGDFLQIYEQYTHGSDSVICGGVYYGNKPASREVQLQWRVQQLALRHRARISQRGLYEYVTTGNFLIRRALFETIRFDEKLTGYGQEDQIFSLELKKLSITPVCINNPVLHDEQTLNRRFVSKIEQSMVNLVRIWHADAEFRPQLERTSYRLRATKVLRWMGLAPLLRLYFKLFWKKLRNACIDGRLPAWCFSFYQMVFILAAFREPNLDVFIRRIKANG